MTARTRLIAAIVGPLWLGTATAPASAQSVSPPIEDVSAPEAFVHVGRFRAGGDEGTIGNGASYGSTLTVPLAGRVALDLDVQTSQLFRSRGRPNDFYRTRRTLVIPSVLYRFGREGLYGYVGGGIGTEFDGSTYRQDVRPRVVSPERNENDLPFGWQEVSPGVFELNQFWDERKVSFRGGFAAFPLN